MAKLCLDYHSLFFAILLLAAIPAVSLGENPSTPAPTVQECRGHIENALKEFIVHQAPEDITPVDAASEDSASGESQSHSTEDEGSKELGAAEDAPGSKESESGSGEDEDKIKSEQDSKEESGEKTGSSESEESGESGEKKDDTSEEDTKETKDGSSEEKDTTEAEGKDDSSEEKGTLETKDDSSEEKGSTETKDDSSEEKGTTDTKEDSSEEKDTTDTKEDSSEERGTTDTKDGSSEEKDTGESKDDSSEEKDTTESKDDSSEETKEEHVIGPVGQTESESSEESSEEKGEDGSKESSEEHKEGEGEEGVKSKESSEESSEEIHEEGKSQTESAESDESHEEGKAKTESAESDESHEEGKSKTESAESDESHEEGKTKTESAESDESKETSKTDSGESDESKETSKTDSGESDESDETKEHEKTDETESDESEESEEEEVKIEREPIELRSRTHVDQILGLDDESMESTIASEKPVQITLRELKKMYESAVKPMEVLYKFKDISNRFVGDPEIFSKPIILFIGPWSSGKSSIINYLLDTEDTLAALKTGAEPQSNGFTVLMHGETEQTMDGMEIAADWTFSSLQKFGQSFLDKLQGLRLPNNLLRKVTIIDTPGIIENRKQQERAYPFNDACQWFIDRADIIYVVFDPTKLDMGLEMEALFDQLKGRESQARIVLNKADQVSPQELMKVQSTLLWNLSPLLGSSEPPTVYVGSFRSHQFLAGSPSTLFYAQEHAFLQDLRQTIDGRVENKISFTRRHAVRVRNHAKMVDCYLNTYYNHKTFFSNKKKIAEEIIDNPQNYHIYEGLSTLTNISRYDLPDPDIYRDFFKVNPLYDFKLLASTCSYFKGCPLDKLDLAIAYELPELMGKYRKIVGFGMEGKR